MIIECSECHTRYTVPNASLGDEGRDVRCANCGITWFQAPPGGAVKKIQAAAPPREQNTTSSEEETLLAAQKTSFLNALKNKAKKRALNTTSKPSSGNDMPTPAWMHTLKIAAISILLLASILTPVAYHQSLIEKFPTIGALLEPLGIADTSGLALADVKFTRKTEGEKESVTLTCNVINESAGARVLPYVVIRMLDSSGTLVHESENLVQSGKNMPPGAIEPCTAYTVEGAPKELMAQVDLGHRLDLSIRSPHHE